MKIILFLTLIFVLLNCKSYGKSKIKKGKKGNSVTLGGDFLGDITPVPNSVYNLHVDLSKNYELNDFIIHNNEKINNALFLMYKEHYNTMKELQEIMNLRQELTDHLISEAKKLKNVFKM
ncbi:conserved Plasmodium protein, unknown function [Plasmodium gallinaceum]|uniref:Fam-b protein n=1 Tax=Plasmodium gallinaceum TaxID=5849 RepID=A0A1J1GZ94_PLAGA|nr:conserved Plasmodium protein, unknown function [Plasmodium gallinaceum]CRG97886.1 conserved Plasmodium protein, unknown function [Plasmodium gallinaceum]